MRWLLLLTFVTCTTPLMAAPALVQQCSQTNSTFFSTTTASCTLPSPVGANHILVVTGYSCRDTCYAVGVQASHAISDTLGFTYVQDLYTIFASPRRGGNVAAESMWHVETGATTGSDTITLTLNTAAGNGILVTEWSGIATSSPVVGSPNATLGSYAGGGPSPVTFTGGSIVIGGTTNTIIALGTNGASASDWIIQFVAFQAVTGNDLIYVHADCENCNSVFVNIPPGYTKFAQAIGSQDEVDMSVDALPFTLHGRKQLY